MGLDIYFYIKNRAITNTTISDSEIIDYLKQTTEDNSIMELLKQLEEYSKESKKTFKECLYNSILDYLNNRNYCKNVKELTESAYFRKVWFLMDFFEYGDDDYGTDKIITKEKIQELKEYLEELINKVQAKLSSKYKAIPKDREKFLDKDLTEKMEGI